MLTLDDRRFLTEQFPAIDGWCVDEAAWLTASLLHRQSEAGHRAPLFEIGVFKGRYFSTLAWHARKTGTLAWGFDTFAWVPLQEVDTALRRALDAPDSWRLVQADSRTLTPTSLAQTLGAEAAFASIDGDHNAEPVRQDLRLADAVLAPWGIIAVDDFYNPMAIGVSEGLFRFMIEDQPALVPFAHSKNKLYLARPPFRDFYSQAFVDSCRQNPELPGIAAWLDTWKNQGENWVKQNLLGVPVWVMP